MDVCSALVKGSQKGKELCNFQGSEVGTRTLEPWNFIDRSRGSTWLTPPLQPPLPVFMSKIRHATRSIMSAIACKHLRPRKFAPLGSAEGSTAPPLKGIVFDVDGTLW